jgi:pyruvate,water dikinase
LTQLTLGVDRDSEIVAFDFDERDPGMLEMLRLTVTGQNALAICDEAPANYPEIARFLTEIALTRLASIRRASWARSPPCAKRNQARSPPQAVIAPQNGTYASGIAAA